MWCRMFHGSRARGCVVDISYQATLTTGLPYFGKNTCYVAHEILNIGYSSAGGIPANGYRSAV